MRGRSGKPSSVVALMGLDLARVNTRVLVRRCVPLGKIAALDVDSRHQEILQNVVSILSVVTDH